MDEHDVQRELAAHKDRARAAREAILARKELNLHSEVMLASLELEDTPVIAQDVVSYRAPRLASRIIPRPLARQLSALLEQLRALNEAHVGVGILRTEIQLHADPELRQLLEAWLAWAEAYVAHRLSRSNPKDEGNPLSTYLRICDELLPWFDELAFGQPEVPRVETVHRHILGTVTEFIPWRLYHATWSRWITPTRAGGATFTPEMPISQAMATICRGHLDLYAFHTGAGLDFVLAEVEPSVSVSEDAARIELQQLADDIEEMRPFLVRATRAERFVLALGEGLHVAPFWVLLQGHVALGIESSERALRASIKRQRFAHQLLIGFDGLVRHPIFHWRTAAHLAEPALAANLTLVRAVHAKLLEAFSRIDLARVLRAPEPSVEDHAAALEALARANALLAQSADEDLGESGEGERGAGGGERGTQARSAMPNAASVRLSPRLSQLLVRLEREFGCEVRSGKGSELSIYRPGVRIHTLGRHKRNDRIRWPHLRRILRNLGIAEQDWVRSVCG